MLYCPWGSELYSFIAVSLGITNCVSVRNVQYYGQSSYCHFTSWTEDSRIFFSLIRTCDLFFYCKKDFCLAFYGVSGEHHGFLRRKSTICVVWAHLAFDNDVFYYKLKSSMQILIERKVGGGGEGGERNPLHTPSNIPAIQKLAHLWDNFHYKCICGIAIKHEHIPRQSKRHHKSSV